MKQLFVPYSLALLAKEKRFNEECLAYYYTDNKELNHFEYIDTERDDWTPNFIINKPEKDHYLAAPLYQQLIDWFRENHKWHIYIRENLFENGPEYRWSIRNINQNMVGIGGNLKGYSSSRSKQTYQEALDSALEQAFKLIEP